MASIATGYIGKVTIGENTYNVGSTIYGVSSTAANVAEKTVEMTGFKLIQGATIHVKFTNSNTAATPTLNVNSEGPKQIMAYGTTKAGTTSTTSWYAGSVVSFTYDGTYWVMNNYKYNTDTNTNTDTLVKQTVDSSSTDELPILVRSSASSDSGTAGEAKYNGGVTVQPSTGTLKATAFSGDGSSVTNVNSSKVNGHTVNSDVPANALFTDHITSVTVTGTGNVVSAISSDDDGNVTVTKGITAVTSTSSLAPKASPTFTGTPKAPTAADGTNTTQIATTAFVQSAIDKKLADNDAMRYQGTIAGAAKSTSNTYGALTPAANKGDTYKVTTAGYVNGVAVEVGDMMICNTDSTAEATASTFSTIKANWDIIQANIDGAVVGPSSSVANNIPVFDGTTGKVIKDSGIALPESPKFTDTKYTAGKTSIYQITGVGSAPTLGDAISADDITAWDAGSAPTLGTAISADDITAWSAGSSTTASVTDGVLTISIGTAPSLSYTARSIPNVTSVGKKPSLSYTERSIPNVTSVGSAPSRSSISVVTSLTES